MSGPEAQPGPPGEPDPKTGWQLPSWRRVAEFFANVVTLEHAVESLREQNRRLENEVGRLQRQVDEQAGQLKVLVSFVETSLSERVERQAARAAASVVERLIAVRGETGPDRLEQ